MREILIILLALGLFFLSTTAEGSNWEMVTKSKDGDSVLVFVDTESIKHISKTVVRTWVKFLFEKPEPTGLKFLKSQLVYSEYDCSEGKLRNLQAMEYYTDGTYEDFPSGSWKYIAPDTLYEAIHNYLCKSKK
jgi:hypothetical protein